MARFLYALIVVGVAVAAAQDYSATNYNAGDSGRSETVSPDGSVSGQYSYTDPNGKLITVKYRAGKDGFQVEGDHLPKSPAVPQQGPPAAPAHHQPQAPTHAPNGYNPFHNPNVPAHLYQQAPTHPPQTQAAPTHAPNGYNPFHNPDVPAHLYQQAPTHPPPVQAAPTHAPNGYNPFHNPHVPAHLYQQAPTHAPARSAPVHAQNNQASAVPTHAQSPGQGYNPFYNPDIQNYNPFKNPNVPDHLYAQAPQRHHHQQAPAAPSHHHSQAPGGQFPAGTFSGFNHPNALPGAGQKSDFPGFTFNRQG